MGYFRKAEEKRRLEKLYDQTWSRYGCGVYWSDRKGRYIRYYPYSQSHCNGMKKFYRRIGNRRIRRIGVGEDIPKVKGCTYKRVFDLDWMMW